MTHQGNDWSLRKGPQPTAFVWAYISATELELWDQVTQSVVQILIYVLHVCRGGVTLVVNRTLVLYHRVISGLSKVEIQGIKSSK